MNAESIPFWLALVIQVGLGLAVFRANPRNYANKCFLVVSVFIPAWLLSLQFAFNATDAAVAEFWIRNAWASGVLIINGFSLLRLAVVCRDTGWGAILKRSAPLAMLSVPAIIICYTHSFLRYAQIRGGQMEHSLVPEPVYGPLFPVFVTFLGGAIVVLIILYLRSMFRTVGMQKVELQFIVVGGVTLAILVAVSPIFVERSIAVTFAPFRIVVFSLIIAYGIATRKILEVGFFIRRVSS
jgi:hypothetical protein